jgi:hypothetical protein
LALHRHKEKKMGQFKPMVKMMTTEPSVILKLKKGGKVGVEMHEENGHKAMNADDHEDSEHGYAPKKPSMAERRKAMKVGKVARKAPGGMMPMGGMEDPSMPAPDMPMPMPMPMPKAMSRPKVKAMNPKQSKARRAMLMKAIAGMKKGGGMDSHIMKLEKELHHHESMPISKVHLKADGGAITSSMARTTIKGNAGKYLNTDMETAEHGSKAKKGSGEVKMGNGGGYKMGGNVDYENRPANTTKAGKTNTTTGEVRFGNAGGYKMGGKSSKKAYATGGTVDTGKPVAMPKKPASSPVSTNRVAGTFKHGGKIDHHASGGSQRDEYDPNDYYVESEDSDGRISSRPKRAESRYSETAVNKSIASSNRSGRKIGGKEAKAIHNLLRGRH